MPDIFADDSTADDKRAAMVARLMTMCPAPYRVVMRDMVRAAVERMPDADLATLNADLDRVTHLAAEGDTNAIMDLARKYGATEQHMMQFGGMFAQR
jgi:hypothetical protein